MYEFMLVQQSWHMNYVIDVSMLISHHDFRLSLVLKITNDPKIIDDIIIDHQ